MSIPYHIISFTPSIWLISNLRFWPDVVKHRWKMLYRNYFTNLLYNASSFHLNVTIVSKVSLDLVAFLFKVFISFFFVFVYVSFLFISYLTWQHLWNIYRHQINLPRDKVWSTASFCRGCLRAGEKIKKQKRMRTWYFQIHSRIQGS